MDQLPGRVHGRPYLFSTSAPSAVVIVYPTVASGQARVRTIVTAEHTEAELKEALDAFDWAGRKLGLI
ncbi:MAG: hypothetical protein ACRDH0_12965 [Actinomycetota bacterium]